MDSKRKTTNFVAQVRFLAMVRMKTVWLNEDMTLAMLVKKQFPFFWRKVQTEVIRSRPMSRLMDDPFNRFNYPYSKYDYPWSFVCDGAQLDYERSIYLDITALKTRKRLEKAKDKATEKQRAKETKLLLKEAAQAKKREAEIDATRWKPISKTKQDVSPSNIPTARIVKQRKSKRMTQEIIDQLLQAHDTQLDAQMKPLIQKWSIPPSPIQILEVLDHCIHGALASGFVVKLLQICYANACEDNSTTHEEVVKNATWRR